MLLVASAENVWLKISGDTVYLIAFDNSVLADIAGSVLTLAALNDAALSVDSDDSVFLLAFFEYVLSDISFASLLEYNVMVLLDAF